MRAFLVMMLVLAGCGGDDDSVSDAGITPADTGGSEDSGSDAEPMGQTLDVRIRYVDTEGNPLEGVWVAVASDLERVEAQSDSGGEVEVPLRYEEDSFRAIAALEGYTIVANNAFTTAAIAQFIESDGFLETTLLDISPEQETFRMRVSATGVPAGGTWCAAFGAFQMACFGDTERLDFTLPVELIGTNYHDELNGFAYDADGTLVDFLEAPFEISGDDRSATLAFDAELPEHQIRSFSLLLPEDAMSPFRTEELDPEWRGWINAASADQLLSRGVPANIEIMDDRVTLNLHIFDHESGLIWAMAPYANLTQQIRTFRWFAEAPSEDTLSFMDSPRVTAGSAYSDLFEWTAPAEDVETYSLVWRNNAGRTVINGLSRASSMELLELPQGYDREVSFPFAEAPGTLQVFANRGTVPEADDMGVTDFAVDGENASSPRHAITW